MSVKRRDRRAYNQRYYRERKESGWYAKNRERLLDLQRSLYYRNKAENNPIRTERLKKRMQNIRGILGNQCEVCKLIPFPVKYTRLAIHDKRGINHRKGPSYFEKVLKERPTDLVLLCPFHHRIIHFLKEELLMDWGEVQQQLQFNKLRKK
jgi:predicted HNH restriction endonuclease